MFMRSGLPCTVVVKTAESRPESLGRAAVVNPAGNIGIYVGHGPLPKHLPRGSTFQHMDALGLLPTVGSGVLFQIQRQTDSARTTLGDLRLRSVANETRKPQPLSGYKASHPLFGIGSHGSLFLLAGDLFGELVRI